MAVSTTLDCSSKRAVWTLEDQRQTKALVLLDYFEKKQEAAVLREKLSQIGDFYVTVGTELKKDPYLYAAKQYAINPQSGIDALVVELTQIEEKLGVLQEKLAGFGLLV